MIALCRTEYPRLVGALRLTTGNWSDAEDLAQDAIVRLYCEWPKVSMGSSPRGWLYRVAFNLATSRWRHQRVRDRVEAALRSRHSEVEDHAIAIVERAALRQALRTLSERERKVVVLRFFLDLDVTETAEILRISPNATRSLCHRAIGKLRGVVRTLETDMEDLDAT